MKMSTNRVIAVDLDGTLTYSDTLYESILVLIREKPIFIFAILFWLFLGKAYLKAKIASLAYFDVTRLPYNQALIDWLCVERASGQMGRLQGRLLITSSFLIRRWLVIYGVI
jgi:hypothetical protein